jgi:heterodisulfide reductase subunit C
MEPINLKNTDQKFKHEVAGQHGGENIFLCFTCLTCVGICPVTQVNTKFNPLRIMRMALLGLKEELLASEMLWLCSSCYACQEGCPMTVRITDILTILKNMAVKEGYAPTGIRTQRDIIKSEGRIYPLDDFDNKKRNKIGLPSLPTTCEVVKDLLA